MENEEEKIEGQMNDEEDLFDLSLDDLSPEDIDQEPIKEESDEEIIELMDLIEKGEKNLESDNGELDSLLDEGLEAGETMPDDEESLDIGEPLESMETDFDLSDISVESDLGLEKVEGEETGDDKIGGEDDSEGDLVHVFEDQTAPTEDMAVDHSVEQEKSLEDLVEEQDIEESILGEEMESEEQIGEEGFSEEVLGEAPDEETGEVMDMTIEAPIGSEESLEFEGLPLEEEDILAEEEPDTTKEAEPVQEETGEEIILEQVVESEWEESPIQAPVQEKPAISEERIEAILVKVVEDVVERVVRETVSNVAEKVITEAIDALKQSIESRSGQSED